MKNTYFVLNSDCNCITVISASIIILVLRFAVKEGVFVDQSKWVLGFLVREDILKPALITTSGETLTQREKEVLSLIWEGMNNREIADSLVTVTSPPTNKFHKLDGRSRTQAAAIVAESNLF